MNGAKSWHWWKVDRNTGLRVYFLGFAVMWPPCLIFLFAVLQHLFHVPIRTLVFPWIAVSASMVLGGAPLLYWAHKNSLRTGSARPVVLATELMFLWCLLPFGYFLVEREGFDLWPAIITALIVLVPFASIWWYPPKHLCDRIEAARKRNAAPDS